MTETPAAPPSLVRNKTFGALLALLSAIQYVLDRVDKIIDECARISANLVKIATGLVTVGVIVTSILTQIIGNKPGDIAGNIFSYLTQLGNNLAKSTEDLFLSGLSPSGVGAGQQTFNVGKTEQITVSPPVPASPPENSQAAPTPPHAGPPAPPPPGSSALPRWKFGSTLQRRDQFGGDAASILGQPLAGQASPNTPSQTENVQSDSNITVAPQAPVFYTYYERAKTPSGMSAASQWKRAGKVPEFWEVQPNDILQAASGVYLRTGPKATAPATATVPGSGCVKVVRRDRQLTGRNELGDDAYSGGWLLVAPTDCVSEALN